MAFTNASLFPTSFVPAFCAFVYAVTALPNAVTASFTSACVAVSSASTAFAAAIASLNAFAASAVTHFSVVGTSDPSVDVATVGTFSASLIAVANASLFPTSFVPAFCAFVYAVTALPNAVTASFYFILCCCFVS